ncbi:MAG: methionine--tRNA ligase [Bacteroidetes Order II. Incertae sedis bacterium]|nr:methionine--tRNA ligase [Bacteroidetes Order II. bacterium]
MNHKRILVTAALPYANGPLHLGHLAGAYLPSDLYVRYQRLKGRDVVFICGSDGHGVPIMLKARAEGVSPHDIVDRYHKVMDRAFQGLGISFDYYGKTTSPTHYKTSQDFFRVLAQKGKFVRKTNEQLFDPEAGIFLADRFVRGTCPICGNPDAYGDQCEKCGTALSPDELINPRSAITDAIPVKKETTHWYLPMGELQPKLEAWIGEKSHWKKNVLGQVGSWFQTGLADRAMTRDLSWGIPVPTDVAEDIDVDGKVLYVWFDAPIGYISATKEWAEKQGDPDRWRTYWMDDETKLVHFIGKDNIVFHCLIFPAMLAEHGEFVLPDNVPANEFLNLEGQKLSTSRGWAVWLHEYLEAFPPDLLRYALAGIFPETKDSDFSWKDFQTRVNSELADVLGNFVNRALTFTKNFYGGLVPPLINPSEADLAVLAELATLPAKIGACYEEFRFRDAVFETMNVARLGNKYFADTTPWHLRKTDEQAAGNVIHVALQICATLSVLMEPVLPDAAAKLREMLTLKDIRSSLPQGKSGTKGWDDAATPLLEAGKAVHPPAILFAKIETTAIQAQLDVLHQRAVTQHPIAPEVIPETPFAPLKETIVYDDFAKLDLRMGTIISAERVPKADKLLCLQIDLGFEKRQILSGIAQQYAPEEVVGKRVVVVANLTPRKMRGLESQGMVLMAENREGTLTMIGSEGENGAPVL